MHALYARIDLGALRHNLAIAKRYAPGCQLFAGVMANAYGHGVREVVTALHDEASGFAVVTLAEAAEVRALHTTARILLLHGCSDVAEYRFAAQLQLDVLVHSEAQVSVLLACELPAPLVIWLGVANGLYGLGMDHPSVRRAYVRLIGAAQVARLNLFGHLAADTPLGGKQAQQQLTAFNQLQDLNVTARSVAGSAALMSLPASHLDGVRPGCMLYGVSPLAEHSAAQLGLRPVMSLQPRLLAINEWPATVVVAAAGAGRSSSMRIGVVNCGYADGYPGQAPSGTPVWVDGRPAPLVGRVGMNQLHIDLSQHPASGLDARVELWGEGIAVGELARVAGISAVELLTRVSARVARRYWAG